jgi:hypothetical protein
MSPAHPVLCDIHEYVNYDDPSNDRFTTFWRSAICEEALVYTALTGIKY